MWCCRSHACCTKLGAAVWAIEPAEELYSATAEVWQRISLTPRLIEHPASADVESFGKFVGG